MQNKIHIADSVECSLFNQLNNYEGPEGMAVVLLPQPSGVHACFAPTYIHMHSFGVAALDIMYLVLPY